MSNHMLRFVDLGREFPKKRAVRQRRDDFDEISHNFETEKASVQAARCSQCGIPFCQGHCPLHNNIPDWLQLAAQNRLDEAYAMAAATNNFPEICGRICPHDRLCEGHCVIESDFDAVTIGAVEVFITEHAFATGLIKPVTPRFEQDQSVGIIGSGPAGLAAAEQLRQQGYGVEIYDRADRAGGLLVYGIPNFKLDKQLVERRVSLLREGGVKIHLDCEIGAELSFAELRARHDAVLIATGVPGARDFADTALEGPRDGGPVIVGAGREGMGLVGVELDGIVMAMDYLTASNRKGFGDSVPAFDNGDLDARGRKVIVIGGGDTAMDCVRTAVRQGARSVQCLYRRDRDNMPGSLREVRHAEEEGVEFIWLSAPLGFRGQDQVTAVKIQDMCLGLPDADGRQRPEPEGGPARDLAGDLVIKALGFDAEDLPGRFSAPDLLVNQAGVIETDTDQLDTSLPGVFAAGDIVRGASLVVWAIRDGRLAAVEIERYLRRLVGDGQGDADDALVAAE